MRPTTQHLFLLILIASLASCGGPQTPGAASPGGPGSAAMPTEAVAPPAADLSAEILGTFVTQSLDAILQRGTGYALPHLPPPLQAMAQPETLKQQLFQSLNQPGLEESVDTTRPVALAMADPEAYSDSMFGPLILAVPVKEAADVVAFIRAKVEKHTVTPWQDHVFTTDRGDFYLRLRAGYALIASQEKLLQGSEQVLLPLVQQAPAESAVLHVDVATIYARYSDKIAQGLAALDEAVKTNPELAKQRATFAMIRKWAGYAEGIQLLRWSMDLQPTVMQSHVRLQAKPAGAFKQLLGQMDAGEPWGAKYLPQDSVLIAVARDEARSQLENFDLALQMLQGLGEEHFGPQVIASWRAIFTAALQHLTGESAIAFWVNADGGLGVGSAYQVTDKELARKAMLQTWQFLDKEIRRLLTKALPPEAKKELRGLDLRLLTRPGALTVNGIKGDLIEIKIRWPKLKDKADQKKLNEVTQALRKIFGPQLLAGAVAVNDAYLMALGKDFRPRLAGMVAAAQAKGDTGMASLVQTYTAGKQMVAFLYLPLVTLTEGVMRVARQVTTIPPQFQGLAHQMITGAGKEVPATLLISLDSTEALVIDGSVSTELIGMIVRGVMGAMSAQGQTP